MSISQPPSGSAEPVLPSADPAQVTFERAGASLFSGPDEFSRLLTCIAHLDAAERLVVLNTARTLVGDQSTQQFVDFAIGSVRSELTGQHQNNAVYAAYLRVYKKNPAFVILALAAFVALIFKGGYELTSLLEHVRLYGFWGGAL